MKKSILTILTLTLTVILGVQAQSTDTATQPYGVYVKNRGEGGYPAKNLAAGASEAPSVLDREQRRLTFSYFLEQQIMLGRWFQDDYLNGNMSSLTGFGGLSVRVHWRFQKGWGVWGQFSMGSNFRQGKNRLEVTRYFPAINMDNYYLKKDIVLYDDYYNQHKYANDDRDQDYDENSRLLIAPSVGISHTLRAGKWSLTSLLSYGWSLVHGKTLEFHLKEKNGNGLIHGEYRWMSGKDEMMDHATIHFEASHKLRRRLSLFFGVSYSQYFDRSRFRARLTDHYTGTIMGEHSVKGDIPKTLGINLGVTF